MYISVLLAVVFAFLLCTASYAAADRRIMQATNNGRDGACENPSDSDIKSSDNPSEDSAEFEKRTNRPKNTKKKALGAVIEYLSSLSPLRWVALAACVLLVGVTAFRTVSFELDVFITAKVIICTELLMSAAVIDALVKKIPNLLSLTVFAFGIISLAVELFVASNNFKLAFLSCIVGLGGSFIILLLISLITHGGLGMGDVKLISAFGFCMGVASVVYSLTAGSVVCLIAAVVLLAAHKKKMKDELPFAPFFFIGFVISIAFGKF